MTELKQYVPIFGMVLAVVAQAVAVALGDNVITAPEFLSIAIALAGAIITYVVPRFPDVSWLKPTVSAATAVLSFFVSALAQGAITAQTWTLALIQLLVGAGIVTIGNGQVPYTGRHGGGLPAAA